MDDFDIIEAWKDELLGEFLLMDDNEYTIELLKRINEVLPEYINRIEELDGSQLNYGRMLVKHINLVIKAKIKDLK